MWVREAAEPRGSAGDVGQRASPQPRVSRVRIPAAALFPAHPSIGHRRYGHLGRPVEWPSRRAQSVEAPAHRRPRATWAACRGWNHVRATAAGDGCYYAVRAPHILTHRGSWSFESGNGRRLGRPQEPVVAGASQAPCRWNACRTDLRDKSPVATTRVTYASPTAPSQQPSRHAVSSIPRGRATAHARASWDSALGDLDRTTLPSRSAAGRDRSRRGAAAMEDSRSAANTVHLERRRDSGRFQNLREVAHWA